MQNEKSVKISAYYDAALSIPPQSTEKAYVEAYQECTGNFDARIGVAPKSDDPNYQRGYNQAG